VALWRYANASDADEGKAGRFFMSGPVYQHRDRSLDGHLIEHGQTVPPEPEVYIEAAPFPATEAGNRKARIVADYKAHAEERRRRAWWPPRKPVWENSDL
jgi:hypothetical protein